MTIVLPFTSIRPPLVRIMVMQRSHWTDAAQPWEPLPMAPRREIYGAAAGYDLMGCKRIALPDIGQARFRYRFGTIDERLYGVDSDGGARDLNGYAVRIQLAPAPSLDQVRNGLWTADTIQWRTCWLGTIEHQEDILLPGKDQPSGDRIYHCEDLLGLTKKWALNQHLYYFSGITASNVCRGHPGYNIRRSDGSLAGNRLGGSAEQFLADGLDTSTHCAYSAVGVDYWTDDQAVNNALQAGRGQGDPNLAVSYDGTGHAGVEAWDVAADAKVFDLISKIYRRQRGRGLAYLDWEDDTGAADDNITPVITVRPQWRDDIVYIDAVDGSTVTIQGQANAGVVASVDLVGDHRVVAGSFKLGDRYANVVDYLETLGDRVEVVITAGMVDGNIVVRYPDPSGLAFLGLDRLHRIGDAFDAFYHLFSFADDYLFTASDGGSGFGFLERIDFRVANGAISQPSNSGAPSTSIIATEICRDLPILDTANPTNPVRQEARLYMRLGPNVYLDGKKHVGLALQIRPENLHVEKGDWDEAGFRYVGDRGQNASGGNLGSVYDVNQLVFTLSLKLPWRAMFTSGDPNGLRKKVLPPLNDLKVHLLHAQAITALDLLAGTLATGYNALRNESKYGTADPSGKFRILRDDRSRLQRQHQLAWAWWGTLHRTATWQLQDCGVLPSFDVTDDRGNLSPVTYPAIGDLVDTLTAGGTDNDLNTPVTGVDYDHEAGVTTWETDWSDLDLKTT